MDEVVVAGVVVAQDAAAESITDPSYFDDYESICIDFEEFPGGGGPPEIGYLFSTEYSELGIVFLAESEPGAYHNTGGLAFWFLRAERYERVDGMPYRSVRGRAARVERSNEEPVVDRHLH